MTDAVRQQNYRKRVKQQGMVDVRLELPQIMRDKIRHIARLNNRTMKAEIRLAIDKHLNV